MAQINETIDIDVPVDVVYREWADLTQLPAILNFVEEVRVVGDGLTHWRVKIAGREHEYEARTLEQVPDSRISWVSVEGNDNAGSVVFEPLGENMSRITLELNWTPEGAIESVGSAVGIDSAAIQSDLMRFRERMEQRHA